MPRTYKKEILGTIYTYIGASRRVLEEALHIDNTADMEEFIVDKCVISPKIDPVNSYAGIITTLSEEILKVSGMTEEGATLFKKESEEWLLSPAGKLESLMMGVFHLSLEEVQNLDPADWNKMALASQLLAVSLYGMDVEKYMSYDFSSPQNRMQKKLNNMPPQVLH